MQLVFKEAEEVCPNFREAIIQLVNGGGWGTPQKAAVIAYDALLLCVVLTSFALFLEAGDKRCVSSYKR